MIYFKYSVGGKVIREGVCSGSEPVRISVAGRRAFAVCNDQCLVHFTDPAPINIFTRQEYSSGEVPRRVMTSYVSLNEGDVVVCDLPQGGVFLAARGWEPEPLFNWSAAAQSDKLGESEERPVAVAKPSLYATPLFILGRFPAGKRAVL